MKFRLVVLVALSHVAVAHAQTPPAPRRPTAPTPPPAPTPRPPAPQPPAAPGARPPASQEMLAFEKDLDALFASGGMTAEDAARRAVKISPAVQRKIAEVDAAVASAQAAQLSLVPVVTARAGYTRLSALDPIAFGPGIQFEIPVNSYTTQAQVALPLSEYLLRFPKLIAAAKLGTQVAKASMQTAEVDAAQGARLAYYEWLRAKLQVMTANRTVVQLGAVLKQMIALAEVQRVSRADVLRVESQLASAEVLVAQLTNLENLRGEQLRITIGAPPEEPLGIGEDIRVDLAPPPSPGTIDQLVAHAIKHRLEFRTLDLGIAAKDKQRDAEKATRLPSLSAFATGDYANPNQRVFPQEQKWDFTWMAGVELRWRLNDVLVGETTLRRIAAETDQLRADRENLLRGVRIELLAAVQAVQLAQVALASSVKGLAASEEGYRVRRELLDAERATAVELVDAETDLTRARITALNARVDLRVAGVQLTHALGNDTAATASK